MTPTKLLIGQILIVLSIMVLGVWTSTQWAASMLDHQPELGPALVHDRRAAFLPAVGAVRLVVSL
jgi:type IV secretion system protein VirD4